MKKKFKVGDKVRRLNGYNCYLNEGETGVVVDISNTQCGVRHDKDGYRGYHNYENLELVKKGKAKKVRPIEKHCILIDSCDNYEAKFNSYKEAEEHAKGISSDVTIYKLVAVAKVKSQRQVRKVTSKRKLVGKR